jgi:hypothetical protein
MKKFLLATVIALAMISSTVVHAVDTTGIEMTKAPLKHETARTVFQLLTIKNNRTTRIGYLGIDCAFFHGDTLVNTHGTRQDNIEAGETVYIKILNVLNVGEEVDRTECRIDYAWGK